MNLSGVRMTVGKEDFEAGIRGDALHRVMQCLPNDRSFNWDDIKKRTGLDTKSLNSAISELHKLGKIQRKWLEASEYYLKVVGVAAQEWYTIDEAANYLRVSRRTIYQLIQEGLLVSYRVGKGGHRRFKRIDLDLGMQKEENGELYAMNAEVPQMAQQQDGDPV